jgi:hypothetical protein
MVMTRFVSFAEMSNQLADIGHSPTCMGRERVDCYSHYRSDSQIRDS